MYTYLSIIHWQAFHGKYYFIVFRHMNIFLELKNTLELLHSNHFFIQSRRFDNTIYSVHWSFTKNWKERSFQLIYRITYTRDGMSLILSKLR